MLGTCGRCGHPVHIDPLTDLWWHAGDADHTPILGTMMTPQAAQALWDGVRRRRKDYVEETEEDADAELDEVVPPELPAYEVDLDDPAVPARAKTMAVLAMQHGWEILMTRARGTPLTPAGKSKAETVREYQTGEDGRPVLSPTGKPTFKNVSTGRPLVVDSVVLRMQRDGVRLVAWWDDGKLGKCLQADPLTILNDTTIKELIKS